MFSIEVSMLGREVRHPENYDRIGTIIEIDQDAKRARVKWDVKRTWIAFKRLRLV